MTNQQQNGDDAERAAYIKTAVDVALVNVRTSLDDHDLGQLESWQTYEHELGTMLRVVVLSKTHGGAKVQFDRMILFSGPPDKDPESFGIIFGSSLQEKLHTGTPIPLSAENENDFEI